MSKIYFMIIVICMLALIFVMIADYGLYSWKRALIASAIDKASGAAIMEIDADDVFAENAGQETTSASSSIFMKDLRIDASRAEAAFWSIFEANTGISGNLAAPYAAFILTYSDGSAIRYAIKKGATTVSGTASPSELEQRINSFIAANYPSSPDSHTIKVNGNPKTEQFKQRPMFVVFIKNWQINGLLSKSHATFISFKGSKAERPGARYDE